MKTRRTIYLFFVSVCFSLFINCVTEKRNTEQKPKPINEFFDNSIPEYDTISFEPKNLYSLSREENRRLWYRDVQNPDTTKFTRYWNDYVDVNYHANQQDFVTYFYSKKDIELAFQMGPNSDLWAYHQFVLRKLRNDYLLCHSYFRHARFTYKAYAVLDNNKVDSLFTVLNLLPRQNTDSVSWNYTAFVADNRNKNKYRIELDQLKSDTTVNNLNIFYDYLDKKIKWVETYK